MTDPGPGCGPPLLVGLLLSELVSCLSVNLLVRLLALPVTRAQLLEHLVVAVVTSAVFTGLAIMTIAAVWTDTTTAVVVGLLALALAAAYRGHRRVQAQQRATEDLYAFVKDLGPVDVHDAHALDALQRVRQLLHAEHLELAVLDGAGGVTRHLTVHREAEPEVRMAADGAAPLVRPDVRGDCMRSPLVVGSTVVGLLTATQRIGSERGFDMRDLRLMETVATELATALDRGRLLLELSRAATIDPLTELPNLRRLTRDLDALLASSPPGLVLAAVSVDSFREVNDALGPRIGEPCSARSHVGSDRSTAKLWSAASAGAGSPSPFLHARRRATQDCWASTCAPGSRATSISAPSVPPSACRSAARELRSTGRPRGRCSAGPRPRCTARSGRTAVRCCGNRPTRCRDSDDWPSSWRCGRR